MQPIAWINGGITMGLAGVTLLAPAASGASAGTPAAAAAAATRSNSSKTKSSNKNKGVVEVWRLLAALRRDSRRWYRY